MYTVCVMLFIQIMSTTSAIFSLKLVHSFLNVYDFQDELKNVKDVFKLCP